MGRFLSQIPTLNHKLSNRYFANAFLHPKFVIQKMIGEGTGFGVYTVNPDAVAVAVGAKQTDFQGGGCNFLNRTWI